MSKSIGSTSLTVVTLLASIGCSSSDYHPPDSEKTSAADAPACPADATYQDYSFCAVCGAERESTRYVIRQWACSPGHAQLAAQDAAPRCAVVPGACADTADGSAPSDGGSTLDGPYVVVPAPDPVSLDAGIPNDASVDE